MSTGIHVITTGNSTTKYYRSLNKTFHQIFGKPMMLHYPFFQKDGEDLEQRQKNLTDYCLREAGNLQGKQILEIGCGNGSHAAYIYNRYKPLLITGIDLNPENIAIANNHFQKPGAIEFKVDNAERLETIEGASMDYAICIESAFHYPDKTSFLLQVQRVLKPGGVFVIADILNQLEDRTYMTPRWKRKMSYHHWTAKSYEIAFRFAGLHLVRQENITRRVIQGYNGHRNWVKRAECRNWLSYSFYQVFTHIQVQINLSLLKHKEHYWLFQGKR
jgi:ubiquinone/menaquinone biosynthesis C-methylase UbiE